MTDRKTNEPIMLRLRTDTIAALRAEAMRRAQASGSVKPSTSEVAQEALDDWFAKRDTPKKRRKEG